MFFVATDMSIRCEFRSHFKRFIILFTGCFLTYEYFLGTLGILIQGTKFSKSCATRLNVHAENITEEPETSCDDECHRFRNVLLNWPQDKPKAAIYYLAKGDRLQKLNSSLIYLHSSFLHEFAYPVIVFHETDSRDLLHRTFRKEHANISMFFQEVQLNTPTYVNASLDKFEIGCKRFPIGYRHMCRFHARQVYEQPILVGLEYVWRLDDDSLLLSVINYDIFVFMKNHRLQYGYMTIDSDSRECTRCFWEAARIYKKLRQIESQYFDKWTEPHIFYNNFEISALSLWKSQQYRDYVNYIDLLGGIYIHRWGDAPIKTIAVTLFLREEDTYRFSNVSYQHQGFINCGNRYFSSVYNIILVFVLVSKISQML